MLEIKDIKVYNLAESMVKSGFPMDTGELVENFEYHVKCLQDYLDKKTQTENDIKTAESHFNRAKRLASTPQGSGHDCWVKGVRVSFNLKYPEYISPQLQRYNWFDIESSQSKMHRLTKMDIEKSCNQYVDNVVIDNLNKWVEIYNKFPIKNSNEYFYSEKTEEYVGYLSDACDYSEMYGKLLSKYEVFMKIISNCPAGLEKWMGVSTNYMQLKTIYLQRKNHKLKSDYKIFCDMVESLPYFKEICLNKLK